jgi:hypothetical protein
MRYLALGLFAEGASDQQFLQRIIYRAVHQKAVEIHHAPVEVQESFVRGESFKSEQRAERIFEAFGKHLEQGAINLLFIHADGDNDADRARDERVAPCVARIEDEQFTARFAIVPVIPVRMTESWALADVAALQSTLGTTCSANDLGLPDHVLSSIESQADPKALLRVVMQRSGAQRGLRREPSIPTGLADRTDLANLRKLTSYAHFEDNIEKGLRKAWNLEPA